MLFRALRDVGTGSAWGCERAPSNYTAQSRAQIVARLFSEVFFLIFIGSYFDFNFPLKSAFESVILLAWRELINSSDPKSPDFLGP